VANVFLALPVPAGDGVGAWIDTSLMAAGKTVSVDGGAFTGTLYLEASNDGQTSAGPVDCPPLMGGNISELEIVSVAQWMRVRRIGALVPFGAPTVNIAAPQAACVFAGLTVPPGDGAGVGADISAGGDVNTFNVVGPFSGQLFIDISTDAGATWSPAILVGSPGQVFGVPGGALRNSITSRVLGVLSQVRVRRAGVLAGVAAPFVSVGSSTLGGSGSSGPTPYDLDPENVDNTLIGPGVDPRYSRGDHVHGLTFEGDVLPEDVVGAGGTPDNGSSPWPAHQDHVHRLAVGAAGFLADIYAAGAVLDPSVDNLLTGPLQRMFINLGTTPPPFPPNAQPFFPEAALFLGEFPADTGVGADSKPLLRTQRHFSTFPSLGDHYWIETQYDLFGGGINQITGGDRIQHVLIDQFDNRLTFAIDVSQLQRPGLNAPGISPIYLDNSPIAYKIWPLMDALGGGNTNDWHIQADGQMFRRGLIPNVVGGGGGPPGPWSLVADEISMWSRNGGVPLVGSQLFYNVLDVQTFGVDDPADPHVIVAASAELDASNLGSGQAAGHGNWYARSTLAGPLVLAMQMFDNGMIFPVGVATTDLDVSANFSVFGAAGGGQQVMGAAVAGAAYGATEQTMLQTAYDVLRFFGFGT